MDINDDSICVPVAPIIISDSNEAINSKINYYPIPLRDELILELLSKQNLDYEFALIEVSSGKVVKELKIEKAQEPYVKISISEISEGMYIFTLKSKGLLVSTGKVVKIN